MALPIIPLLAIAAVVVLASRKKSSQPASTSPQGPSSPGVTPGSPTTGPSGTPAGVPPVGSTTPAGGNLPPTLWPYYAGGAAGCPPAGTPDTGVAGLPSPLRESLQIQMTSPLADPNALEAIANQLDFCGLHAAAAEVRARVNDLRANSYTPVPFPIPGIPGGGILANPPTTTPPISTMPSVPFLPEGPGTGGPSTMPVASTPGTQWYKKVLTNAEVATDPSYVKVGATTDNPIQFTRTVFGPDGENARVPAGTVVQSKDGVTAPAALVNGMRRWVELIIYNASSTTSDTVGDPYQPYGSADGSVPPFNLKSYVPGTQIRVPPSWDAWIAVDGTKRGAPDPWPSSPGATPGAPSPGPSGTPYGVPPGGMGATTAGWSYERVPR